MTAPIAHGEPTLFQAGDTLIWTKSVPSYPSTDGWTLKYAFRGVGSFDAVAAADPSGGYLVTVPSTTSAVEDGVYTWAAWVENTATPVEKHTVDRGRVTVIPQLAIADPVSQQRHAERMLPLIEAQLELLAATPITQYTIEQQTTIRRTMSELESSRAKYRSELSRLKSRGRLGGYAAVMRPSGGTIVRRPGPGGIQWP